MSCDPQLGPQLLEREVDRLENEVARFKAKLRSAQDKIADLERERADRFTRMKGEVVENSLQLLTGLQRSQNEALAAATRRIEFLEAELDRAKTEIASLAGVRRELQRKQAECNDLNEALEELELQNKETKEAKKEAFQASTQTDKQLTEITAVQAARERERAWQLEAALKNEKQEREEFETLVQEELQRLQDELQQCRDTKQQDQARIELLQTSLQQHRDSVEQYRASLLQRDASIVERNSSIAEISLACDIGRKTCDSLKQELHHLHLELKEVQRENDSLRKGVQHLASDSLPGRHQHHDFAQRFGGWLSRVGTCGLCIFTGRHRGSFPRAAACL